MAVLYGSGCHRSFIAYAADKNIALVRAVYFDGEVVLPELRVGERWLSEAEPSCRMRGRRLCWRWVSVLLGEQELIVGFFAKVLDGERANSECVFTAGQCVRVGSC